MKRPAIIIAAILVIAGSILYCAWMAGAFIPRVGRDRPADVYLPDGQVLHTTWEDVFRKLKTQEAYKDPQAGGFRYKAPDGQWGVAVDPSQPVPDVKHLPPADVPVSPPGGRR